MIKKIMISFVKYDRATDATDQPTDSTKDQPIYGHDSSGGRSTLLLTFSTSGLSNSAVFEGLNRFLSYYAFLETVVVILKGSSSILFFVSQSL